MNLSADLGEGSGHDADLIPLIDSASVAGGVYAGSWKASKETVRLCLQAGVEVGVHPGYEDREGFGRREQDLSVADLQRLIAGQVDMMEVLTEVAFVKPHGALYHRCQADSGAARVLVGIAQQRSLAVVAEPGGAISASARELGVAFVREGFADRGYGKDGKLLARSVPGALLSPAAAARQAVLLCRGCTLDTLCLHGDHAQAVLTAGAVRAALNQAGIVTARLFG